MGYILLCVENLAVSLLLLATLEACLGHWQRRRLRVIEVVLDALVVLALYLGLTCLLGWLKFAMSLPISWFYPLAALTVCYMVGVGWIMIAGWRQSEGGLSGPRCALWPRSRLAIALAVAAALHLMTFWNLDLAMWQRLETLRAEAGALALSVAPPRIPDRDNAALVYQQAFAKMGDSPWPKVYDEKWYKWLQPGDTGFDSKDAELRDFLNRQAATLALLREAGNKPGCYFECDYSRPSFEWSPLTEWQKLGGAARLLALDARCKAADHDLHGALVDCRAILAMAEHTSSDPGLISLLVAVAVDMNGMPTLQDVLASAPASAEDIGALEFSCNFSYQRAFQRALRMEEACGQAWFYDVATEKISLLPVAASSRGERFSCPSTLVAAPLYRLFLMEDDQEAYSRFMKQCQQLASQPYFQSKADWEGLKTTGILTRLLLPGSNLYCQCSERMTQADAQRSLLRLALATYRFQAVHGRLPNNTEELMPEFIPVVPQDPFDGKPLRMKKTDGGVVLYSIGPDMTDDDGAVFDPLTKKGDITFAIKQYRN